MTAIHWGRESIRVIARFVREIGAVSLPVTVKAILPQVFPGKPIW
jgi:hypothetical protein